MYKDEEWTELGEFAYASEKQQQLIIHTQTVTIPEGSNKTVLNGDVVDGYSFFCWFACASSGWVGTPYVEYPTNQSTRIFEGSLIGGLVLCYALYVKIPREINF